VPTSHYWNASGPQGPYTGAGTYYGGWHTFAADWEPAAVTFYYDGVSIGAATSAIEANPMFLVMVLQISTAISPPVVVPATMLVDYVRVWQH
jgi:beta-glucanase (GH16 family)